MPRIALWIPEIDSVHTVSQKGHITCSYWTTSKTNALYNRYISHVLTFI